MKYRVLIVEDESGIAQTVADYLEHSGYFASVAYDIASAMEAVTAETDIVILDLMLPDGDGEDFCSYVTSNFNIPVIMLTAKKSEESRINGFARGADDYLIKPFSLRELVARIRAVLKRSRPRENVIKLEEGLTVDLDSRSVYKNGENIRITPNEYRILLCLINSGNFIVSRERLVENIKSAESADRAIDVHIRRLRSKIENNPKNPRIIETVYGYGYKLGIRKL